MKSVRIEAERLRIRKEPSTTADWTGEFAEPGRIYTVLEETENEGFTWARIGNGRWISLYEGIWTKEVNVDYEQKYIELLSFLNDFIEESLKSTTDTLERIREKINR